jgi:acetyl esterase/lipase
MHRWLLTPFALGALTLHAAENKVIRLYDGKPPGSESWTHTEQVQRAQWGGQIVYNVVDPTLTVYQAAPDKANGAAVIVCPGGAFFMLAVEHEGSQVARALNAQGITAFVLKYRLVKCETDNPMAEIMSRGNLDPIVAPIVKLALADGLAAIRHVRTHAADYRVEPARIGIMGFSAGGTVASSVAMNYTADSRPNFVAPIYLAYSWTIKTNGVPADAPPAFLVAATDDQLQLASHSVDMYRDWVAAKKPAELHIFAKGGHGFGMNKQNLPTDRWLDQFVDWLGVQGFTR